MPLTTIYGDGTRIVGDANALEQTLHPTVMAYINIMQSASGGNYIMSINEIDAVNNMVQALVANGILTKMKALYPIIGGTAAAHKFNLIDSRDADAAFRLSFLGGGWIHSANGIQGNGTSSYANTFLNPLAQGLTTASAHLAFYGRTTSTSSDGAEIANFSSAALGGLVIQGKTGFINRYFYGLSLAASRSITPPVIGMIAGSSVSTARRDLYQNGLSVANNNSTDNFTMQNWSLYIGAGNLNNGTPGSWSNAQIAFASIGNGLTATEVKAFSTIVQAFQRKLGRQV